MADTLNNLWLRDDFGGIASAMSGKPYEEQFQAYTQEKLQALKQQTAKYVTQAYSPIPPGPTDLKGQSAYIRERADAFLRLLYDLERALFEPVPETAAKGQNLKDNPDSVEGNLHEAVTKLDNAFSLLSTLVTKIGGR